MNLIEQIKNGKKIFQSQEEVDQLFDFLNHLKMPVDEELDYQITLSMRKLKVQQYYKRKLEQYERVKKIVSAKR